MSSVGLSQNQNKKKVPLSKIYQIGYQYMKNLFQLDNPDTEEPWLRLWRPKDSDKDRGKELGKSGSERGKKGERNR